MLNLETYTSPMLFEDEAYYVPKVLAHIYGFKAVLRPRATLAAARRAQGKGGALDVNGRPWFFRSLNAYVREFSTSRAWGARPSGTSSRRSQRRHPAQVGRGQSEILGRLSTWFSLNYEKLTALYFQYLGSPEPVVKGELQPDLEMRLRGCEPTYPKRKGGESDIHQGGI